MNVMRIASFSTPEPPVSIDNLELKEYVAALRRRIEVQDCLATALVQEKQEVMQQLHEAMQTMHGVMQEKHRLETEVDKLCLDLAIKQGQVGPFEG